jgi:hypothetical protein
MTGAATNCTITLAGGSGSCNTVVFNSLGPKTLTATYNGDGNYTGSSGSASQTVVPAKLVPTVTFTGAVQNPSTPGQSFVVGVSVASTGTTPTGTIAITGADTNCTITLPVGTGTSITGTCNTVVFNTTGVKTLTANYSGDSNYTAASATASHTVNPGPSTTVITSPASSFSVTVGQSVPVSVTVTGLGGTPTGTVNINQGSNLLCTITLAGGSGSCNVVFNTIGSPTITAHYIGDMNYAGSTVTVSGTVTPGTSVTTITSELPDPSAINEPVVISVNVTGAGATPVGTVTVTTTGTTTHPNCTFTTIGGTGNCTLIYTAPTGSFTITAAFTGDPNYNGSSATTSHAVN